jgi:hypothetical protein
LAITSIVFEKKVPEVHMATLIYTKRSICSFSATCPVLGSRVGRFPPITMHFSSAFKDVIAVKKVVASQLTQAQQRNKSADV